MEETQPAILTRTQRKYLRGETDPAQERTVRTRIRKRIRAAVVEDLPLVLEPEGQIEPFSPEEVMDPEHGTPATMRELKRGLEATVALAVRLADAANLDPDTILENGSELAYSTRAVYLADIFEEDPSRLTFEELKLLQQEGKIDNIEFAELYYEFLEDLGFPLPREAWEQIEIAKDESVIDEGTEELDEYGTGVAER